MSNRGPTRMEQIREYLRLYGPQNTRTIGERFGWKMATASAICSHARSYGYIEQCGSVPVTLNGAGSPLTIWRARDQIIRRPSERRINNGNSLSKIRTQRPDPTLAEFMLLRLADDRRRG